MDSIFSNDRSEGDEEISRMESSLSPTVSRHSRDTPRMTSNGIEGTNDETRLLGKRAVVWDGKVTVTSSMSNQTFASTICDQLSFLTSSQIAITNDDCHYVLIPSCINSYGTTVNTLTAQCVVVDSFSWTSGVIVLYLQNSLFSKGVSSPSTISPSSSSSEPTATQSPPSSTPSPLSTGMDGFDENGDIDWTEIFSLMPTLASLSITDGNLAGSLPTGIPSSLTTINLSGNQIYGSIPSDLLSSRSASSLVNFGCSKNHISGTLPPTLFSSFGGSNSLRTLMLDLSENQLIGSIPPSWLQTLSGLQNFQLNLAGNEIDGSLPQNLFPSTGFTASSYTFFSMDLSSNQIVGTIPSLWLNGIGPLEFGFALRLNHNKLEGSLPANFLFNGWAPSNNSATFALSLSDNAFSGTIPPTLITSNLAVNKTFLFLKLELGNNLLTGDIPEQLFYSYITTKRDDLSESERFSVETVSTQSGSSVLSAAATTLVSYSTQSVLLNLTSNSLSGSIPQSLLTHTVDSGNSAAPALYFANNQLSGVFLDTFIQNLPSNMESLQLDLTNNLLTGSLPSTCLLTSSIIWYNDNQFTGSIPSSWSSCPLLTVLIGGNTGITGTIPPALFNSPTLFYLNVSFTGLSGELPSKISPVAIYADMRYTNINFCSSISNSSFSNFTGTSCSLEGTTVCACSASYAMCTKDNCDPNSGYPTTCPIATRPSADFVCVGGIWTTPRTSAEVITIPPNAGLIVIAGNATSTSIVINGLGTSVTIEGCASNLSNIVIQLSADDIAKMSSKTLQTLIVLSSTASQCTDLSTVSISATSSSKTCKKVNAEKVLSADGKTMSSLFTVSSSGCNTWWIILVSVVVGVIIISTAILALLAAFYKPFRAKLRPFSNAQRNRTAGGQV